MTALRALLVIFWLVITAYTLLTIADHGPNFFPDYFRDVALMGWPGQFNLDFSLYLLLTALWIAWRHGFSVGGIFLALCSPAGGMIFFSAYLLFIIATEKPGVEGLLLGKARAAALRQR